MNAMVAGTILISAVALAGCGVLLDGRATSRERAAEAAHPPEGAFVAVGGRQVHYIQRGRGPDVVLIHGASGSTRDFSFGFVDRLATRYRVTAFDRPGLGFTDRASDAFGGALNTAAESPAVQAAMLAAAARELGIVRPVVLGHSYGGAVALAWGLDHDPAALVVVAGASNPWPGGLGALYNVNASALGGAGVVPLITAFAPDDRAARVIDSIFAPQPAPPGYADHIGVGITLRRETLRANARQVNSLRPHVVAMAARYPTLGLPVEIVHGDLDTIVPLAIHSEPLSRQIPGARLTVLPGIGHMPHHAAPEAVEAAVDRAVARAGNSAGLR
jgi:pimeloyl-ACP methyl ester carboxylesterase